MNGRATTLGVFKAYVFFVPRLNEVEEGGVLDYPPSVCLSVRTKFTNGYSMFVLTGLRPRLDSVTLAIQPQLITG